MPTKAQSLRSLNSADDRAPSEAPTATLTAAPFDAPPSFLEKPDRSAPEAPIPHGERSNLQLYLQEIGKTPLLTIEEEIMLSRAALSWRRMRFASWISSSMVRRAVLPISCK